MKIIHIGNHQSIRCLFGRHMKRQSDAGHEVLAITSDQASFDQILGLPVIRIRFDEQKMNPLKDIGAFFRLASALVRENPDLVHTHNVKFGILGRFAARLTGVPVVIHTAHGIYRPFWAGKKGLWFYRWVERFANLLCDRVLMVSPYDRDIYLQEKWVQKKRCLLIRNGIDMKRFSHTNITPDMRQQKREELGIKPDAYVVGMVGRLVEDKGFREFFEMAGMIAKEYPQVHFVIVALSYTRADNISESSAQKAGIEERIHFLYDRDDMPELYSIMNCLVHPSWREGFPRCLMEGSAMGCFMTASDIDGNRNVIEDGKTGVLFPVRDALAMTEKVRWAIQNRSEAAQIGVNAERRAREEFDEEKMYQRIDEAVQDVLSQKKSLRLGHEG